MSYEFAGSLYRNEREMLDAIAEQWLACDGWTALDAQRDILGSSTDAALTAECIKGWALDRMDIGWPEDEASASHMRKHNYTFADLEQAFKRLRARLSEPVDGG